MYKRQVEDDSFLNKMLSYNLTADGYEITSVLNARTATCLLYTSYAEYKKEKNAKAKLKLAIDTLVSAVSDFEELISRLQTAGYEIKTGKYISCRVPGQERFTRLKTLGACLLYTSFQNGSA